MKKRRKNPAFNLSVGDKIGFDVAPITAAAGDILVSTALRGCTFEEKVLISALIPMLVKMLRNAQPTQEEMDKAVEKILNPGNDKTGPNEAKGDGSPTSK